jgi:site-specific DNA recombinase
VIAAVYARKSTEQNGMADEQKSVARQIEHARTYAARKGWIVSDDHVYVDDGISGAEFARRPGFVRLMNALSPRCSFDVLIMSEESRLGREAIETSYALKQLLSANVRVFFYLEDRERTLESPTDKLLMSVAAFADELEREKARQRTFDAMHRKAKAGHNCGGRTFGYGNINVPAPDGSRAFVTYQIHAEEAAVVRRIFTLAAHGSGLKAITKQLNAEGAIAPRPQQGRTRAWAPSTVREILYREMYRGQRVWNKSRKRDSWGRKRQHDRPSDDWLTVPCEELRIVSDAQWDAAHRRMTARREAHDRWKRGEPGGSANGKGVRTRYFLTGFGRCAACGGSMQAVSRIGKGGQRVFHYCCASYWNRGASVCPNGRRVEMLLADRAVHDVLRNELLQPRIIERALDLALDRLAMGDEATTPRETLDRQIQRIEAELVNLSETIATGGAVPAILHALARRDEERRRLTAERATLDGRIPARLNRATTRKQLRIFLDGFSGLLSAHVTEARPVLSIVLAGDRIAFTPTMDGRYELAVPLAFDRVISAAVPELGRLQDVGTSPAGPNLATVHGGVAA